MKIPFWTSRRERERREELAHQRHTDAWADRLIDEYELHLLNEEISLPGDPPYYDSCPAVGDGHEHLSPDWPFYAGFTPPD
jgi:hypothetical protein